MRDLISALDSNDGETSRVLVLNQACMLSLRLNVEDRRYSVLTVAELKLTQ